MFLSAIIRILCQSCAYVCLKRTGNVNNTVTSMTTGTRFLLTYLFLTCLGASMNTVLD